MMRLHTYTMHAYCLIIANSSAAVVTLYVNSSELTKLSNNFLYNSILMSMMKPEPKLMIENEMETISSASSDVVKSGDDDDDDDKVS